MRAIKFYFFEFKLEFKGILWMELGKFNSSKFLESPRNRFHLPRSPRNDKLQFLDSSIPRGMQSSEELPSLDKMIRRNSDLPYILGFLEVDSTVFIVYSDWNYPLTFVSQFLKEIRITSKAVCFSLVGILKEALR